MTPSVSRPSFCSDFALTPPFIMNMLWSIVLFYSCLSSTSLSGFSATPPFGNSCHTSMLSPPPCRDMRYIPCVCMWSTSISSIAWEHSSPVSMKKNRMSPSLELKKVKRKDEKYKWIKVLTLLLSSSFETRRFQWRLVDVWYQFCKLQPLMAPIFCLDGFHRLRRCTRCQVL